MAITVWPADAVSGNPTYAGRALRQTTNAPFLGGATGARPLGARSGVRPGTSTGTVTATSTTWTVGPLAGVIDGEAANEAGPYTFSSDAAVSGSVTAANASNPRVDLVYVQISDPAESDGSSTPGVTIGYLAGSAAATPSAPSTPARSFVLANINVPKSGGGSPSVTWLAPYMSAAGGVASVGSQAERDASNWGVGQRIHRRDVGWDERFTDSGWVVGAGKTPFFTAYKNGSQLVGTGWTQLTTLFASAQDVLGGSFSQGVFTPSISGRWQFFLTFELDSAVTAGRRSAQITVNSTFDTNLVYATTGVTGTVAKNEPTGLGGYAFSAPVPVAAGSPVRAFASSATQAGAGNSGSGSNPLTGDVSFSGVYLGPL